MSPSPDSTPENPANPPCCCALAENAKPSQNPTDPSPPATRTVAIAGNPNCGKSTIFNALSGLRQKVGNYPGVTVERKVGRFFGSHGEPMTLLDLPGSYSLQAHSPDEAVSRDVLLGRLADTPRPDALIVVVDASNLERNLYLAAQLLDLRLPTVLALNMVDVAEQNGMVIDVPGLERELGIPVVPMVASKGVGLVELRQAVSRTPLPQPALRAPVPGLIAEAAQKLAPVLESSAFAEALLLLTLHKKGLDELAGRGEREAETAALVAQTQEGLRQAGVEPLSAVVQTRYEWIGELCSCVVRKDTAALGESGLTFSDKLDRVLTHRFWGWVAFLGAMAAMFFCIFQLAQLPMDWIEAGFGWAGEWVKTVVPEGDLQSLLVDGVIAGVGGVVVFLPQILVLFFFLGLLEDSGYMARAAFIMDRVMAGVGLHGKSFIPLLSSFACAIPGVMATRTIENRKDRLVTILVAPLMSCSARLPVYTLMIAVLLPAGSPWAKAGIMLAMYAIGTLAAFCMAWLFKRTLLRSETPLLLLELPPYRMPSLGSILLRMWERGRLFLTRAGTLIFAFAVILWALAAYPKPADPETTPADALAQSYAGRMGHFIEPAIAPLGYDWKIGVGLLSSFAARELFVSTMAIVYSVEAEGDEEVNEESATLRDTMRAEKRPDGTPVYTPLICVSLMVFYVLAMQCLAAVAVVRRETNSWRWPLFQLAYMIALAWGAAFVIYQGGRLIGWQ